MKHYMDVDCLIRITIEVPDPTVLNKDTVYVDMYRDEVMKILAKTIGVNHDSWIMDRFRVVPYSEQFYDM